LRVIFETVTHLNPEAERLLRGALNAADQDTEGELRAIRAGLSGGSLAAGLVRETDTPLGLAIWRWEDPDRRFGAVDWLTVRTGAPESAGEALVAGVWAALGASPALAMIGARLRGDPPGVRTALARRACVVFERHFMLYSLRGFKPSTDTLPDGYRLAAWTDGHQAAVEALAVLSLEGSPDSVVLSEAQPDQMAASLRQLRTGAYPGSGPWNDAASRVMLAADGAVAGYLAATDMGRLGFIMDGAVHPAHQRRGLAHHLIEHCLAAYRSQGFEAVGLAVTALNPARQLYEGMGFVTLDVGQTAIWWADGRQLAWQDGE
jgi:ribosomal protein S18 acetylase RimI-like enzyme